MLVLIQTNRIIRSAGSDCARTYHPLHEKIVQPLDELSYYWTAPQTEFASDVLFRDQAALDRLFPQLILHGMFNLGSAQVMRFWATSSILSLAVRLSPICVGERKDYA